MCKCNWRQYKKALVQRARLSCLIDPKCLNKLKPEKREGSGLPIALAASLILMLFMIKVHFKLPSGAVSIDRAEWGAFSIEMRAHVRS